MRLSDAAHARSLPQQLGCALLNGCVSWVAAQTHFSAPRLSHTHMGSILHTRGSFSTRWRAQGTRNPARSGSAQPERTLLLKHTYARTHREQLTKSDVSSSLRDLRRHSVLFIDLAWASAAADLNCVWVRRGRTCPAGQSAPKTR